MQNEKYQTRKARSIQMLKSGVEPIKDGFNEYYIPSQIEKNKKYKITIKDGWYSCECPDNQDGNLCKHILLLKTYLAIKLQAKNIKQNISITKPCPYCESNNIIKDGTRKTTLGKKQRWLCKECKARFVLEPIKKIKGNADIVTLCMDLFFKGFSYRKIQDTLQQFNGLKVHHETIRRWINKYMKKITKYTDKLKPKVSGVWHTDEQALNIKKEDERVWCWNVMDSKTRFLLANQITKERYVEDARKVFRKAKKTANKTATKVITDGLRAYEQAVRKEFMTYKNRKPHYRVKSFKDKPHNNLIERYHGTFRERDKVMRAFQNEETAQQNSDNYRTYYNFVRKHSGINNLTPAQASGINETRKIKELLVKSL